MKDEINLELVTCDQKQTMRSEPIMNLKAFLKIFILFYYFQNVI